MESIWLASNIQNRLFVVQVVRCSTITELPNWDSLWSVEKKKSFGYDCMLNPISFWYGYVFVMKILCYTFYIFHQKQVGKESFFQVCWEIEIIIGHLSGYTARRWLKKRKLSESEFFPIPIRSVRSFTVHIVSSFLTKTCFKGNSAIVIDNDFVESMLPPYMHIVHAMSWRCIKWYALEWIMLSIFVGLTVEFFARRESNSIIIPFKSCELRHYCELLFQNIYN